MIHKIPLLTLHTGAKIPQVAFGTYKVKGQDTKAVQTALDLGYRHFDDAYFYQNQKDVGQVLKKSGIPREQLFVTSKVWPSHMSKQGVLKSVQTSLNDLQMEYLDLLLIHWPCADGVDPNDGKKLREIRLQVWNTFIDLKKQGKVKEIGVSNFQKKHLEPLLETSQKPVVNQLMLNPYFVMEEQVEFCKKHGILIQSWSPLARAEYGLMDDEVIKQIAKRHNKSTAQICLRWNVQHGNIILPKSVTPQRIQQNINIFDFQLTKEEMKQIDGLHKLGKMKAYDKMLCE